jgi:CBS domain-containing protein
MHPTDDTADSISPLWIEPSASLREAAARMAEHGTSSILVGSPGELVSILTEHDMMLAVARGVPHSTSVGEFAVPRPLTIDVGATVHSAGRYMLEQDVRHLVVTRGNRAVGVLSMRDVLHAFLGLAETPVVLAVMEEHLFAGACGCPT